MPKLICALYIQQVQPKHKHDIVQTHAIKTPMATPLSALVYSPSSACHHVVCYGFEVMETCESPQHPFEIFRSCPPRAIIYDNTHKLHQYCLNRESHFFQNTPFAVDRFHWKGHVRCSSGYSLDSYKLFLPLAEINSQVNEQATAGLQQIQAQLAYMTADNFMFFNCSCV